MQSANSTADTAGRRRRRTPLIVGLTLLMILSLLLNAWTLVMMTRMRGLTQAQIGSLAEQLEYTKSEVISVSIPIKQGIPVQARVPVQKELQVPIQMSVPINEQIVVPLETPFGIYEVPVPINMTVPISTVVPIMLSETLEISTSIQLDMDFPVTIPIASTPLAEYLEKMRQALLQLQRDL